MARQADSLIAVTLCTFLRQRLGNDSNDPRSKVFGYSVFRIGNSITHAATPRAQALRPLLRKVLVALIRTLDQHQEH